MTPHNVFYAGGESEVKTALTLAGYTLVTDPDKADVFVLNGEIPDAAGIAEQVKNGAGLVLIPGKDISQQDVQTLLGQPVTLTDAEDAVSLTNAKGCAGSLPNRDHLEWSTAGEGTLHRKRIRLPGPATIVIHV